MRNFTTSIHSLFSIPTLILLVFTTNGTAQEPAASELSGRPRVFLDCPQGCPETEIRARIPGVNWVRAAADSHVHVLVTSQPVGGGGERIIFDFIGQGDSSSYLSQSALQTRGTDTGREVTDRALHTLALGLATFADAVGFRNVARLEWIEGNVEVVPTGIVASSEVEDPWNLWTFRTNAGGNFNGESSRRGYTINAGFNGSRTTPIWKTSTSASWSIINDERRTKDEQTEEWNPWSRVDYRIAWNVNSTIVYALAEHWSVGVTGGFARTVTQNQRLRFQMRPGIEYSYFPYEESTRRALTVFYGIGPIYRDYFESTVLGESSDLRLHHELSVGFSQRQPWGNASISASASSLIPEWKYHNFSLNGNLSYRLTRGISLDLSGNASRVKDQIYLANRGLTPEEELLRLRTAGTDYTYRGSVGISYQFGSIYNNVVNTRFPGGG
jgi:hypothetical protein